MSRQLEEEDSGLIVQGPNDGAAPNQKKVIAAAVVVIVSISLIVVLVMLFAVNPRTGPSPKRNVIMMISDGWGPAAATLARTFSGKPLALDPYLVGTVRTFSASSLVTDSAAGATAYSCGKHTYNGGIGVDGSAVACGTVLEAASKKGLRTGVVTTTRVTDATPAAFISHASDRDYEDYIATQVIDMVGFQKHMDVILGGGLAHFNSMREDGTSILPQAIEKGYTVISNSAQLANITGGKVLGLFSEYNMPYAIDRYNNATLNTTQPSLMDMTRKALQLLDNEDGFFVMLEGALIDVAEHANDAGAAIREVLEYNEAFSIALEYAKQHGNTIIISTSDHETGGLTLGLQTNFTVGAYPDYAYYPQTFAPFNASCDTMARRIIYNGEDVKTVIASSTNITDITDEEVTYILSYITEFAELSGAIGKTVASRALVGWTTHGHTGVDVNLYIYGLPADHSYFGANVENIDVATLIAQLLDLDVSAITAEVEKFPTNESTTEVTEKVTRHSRDHYHSHL